MFFDDHFFEGGDVDLTMFPPACLPKKGQHFTGSASVYGRIIVIVFLIFLFSGWGERDWDGWQVNELFNDDKLHEVEVKLLL